MFGSFFSAKKEILKLGDHVSDATIGVVRGSKNLGENHKTPYFRMNAIGREGSFSYSGLKKGTFDQDELKKYSMETGDLLFNTRNSQELVGKTTVLQEKIEGVYNNNILRVRFTERLNSNFIDYYLRTSIGQRELNLRKSGTTNVFAIYQKSFFDIPIVATPENLQIKFATNISSITNQKNIYSKSLANIENLFVSLQQRAFRGEL